MASTGAEQRKIMLDEVARLQEQLSKLTAANLKSHDTGTAKVRGSRNPPASSCGSSVTGCKFLLSKDLLVKFAKLITSLIKRITRKIKVMESDEEFNFELWLSCRSVTKHIGKIASMAEILYCRKDVIKKTIDDLLLSYRTLIKSTLDN